MNGSAVEAGHAASKAENTKRNKYSLIGNRYRFEPVAIETSGVFGSSTRNIVNEIGRRISEKNWREKRINVAEAAS